jgi:hypothetical protein
VDGDCGKIDFGDKPSYLNMCYFHDTLVNIYCEKAWGIIFCATLIEMRQLQEFQYSPWKASIKFIAHLHINRQT